MVSTDVGIEKGKQPSHGSDEKAAAQPLKIYIEDEGALERKFRIPLKVGARHTLQLKHALIKSREQLRQRNGELLTD